jgi:hypothetical protein
LPSQRKLIRPAGEIEPPELLAVLCKIDRRPAVITARKRGQSCGQIFCFAIAEARRCTIRRATLLGRRQPVCARRRDQHRLHVEAAMPRSGR